MISDEEFNSVSQNSHWAGGLAWVFGSIVLFGPKYVWCFFVSGVMIAAAKEFWYDEKFEDTEVRGSSVEDFSFYCVGLFGALAAYYVKTKVFHG